MTKWFAILLPLICGLCCYQAAGDSLDFFLGSFFFAAILAGQSPGDRVSTCSVMLGLMCCWWLPVHHGVVTIQQWLMCSLVLFTFVGAISALVQLFCSLGRQVGSALVTLFAMAWLTWPVWLSVSPPGALVLFHPLFAINHELLKLGIWTEQQGAYGLITLGQDSAYQLPHSVLPVIGMQSGIAMMAYLIFRWLTYVRKSKKYDREHPHPGAGRNAAKARISH